MFNVLAQYWGTIRRSFAAADSAALKQAQLRVMIYQLPMMYGLLIINTWGMVLPHEDAIPGWQGVACPVVFTGICVLRVVSWIRRARTGVTAGNAAAIMRNSGRLAWVFSISFTAWSLSLLPYGGAAFKLHVAFYMAITVIGVIFCLMHVIKAAFTVTAIVNGALVVTFLSSGNSVFQAIAIDTSLVSLAMLVVSFTHFKNFSDLVAAQGENKRLANIDSLTNLPNRRAFFASLDKHFDSAQTSGSRLAVGLVDLDGFKSVNDIHGHSVGDHVLAEVASRLATAARGATTLARLGGDEFGIIVTDDCTDTGLSQLGLSICDVFRHPVLAGDISVRLGATIGFSTYPHTSRNKADLFEAADYALYEGKRCSRGTVTIFSETHRNEIIRESRIAQALRSPDLGSELHLAFQPIFSLDQQRTVGFEALARWQSALLGTVAPGEFIPAAERSGVINELTLALFTKALACAKQWPAHIGLSFNLSAHDFASEPTVKELAQRILSSGIEPARLDFEITETAMANDFDQVQKTADVLRGLGCGLSVDDFGTGYSSLSYLCNLPLTRLKIDRTFVSGLKKGTTAFTVVRTLLNLSRQMALDCVIEGVETAAELKTVAALGATLVQGYYCSRPMDAPAVAAFLKKEEGVEEPDWLPEN
ncbi:putative bifunctional diguanylate cyclase/phosphodiesterase [Paraburkholderia lycopersici]|uniref:Diguanylate cyclase (GGDEF) domain-containing protein n=1 Tax=Paraburkholderia lycopersici TaxID=416944 RepID=A0A1G6MQM4_9BURK|nr:EAL domain-containing protein [Paraburkholderia lycopersici]SDC57275.1 diguanylate cyclase (GGDEF) domain-containing protein [Paraburkholderia lycopersici]